MTRAQRSGRESASQQTEVEMRKEGQKELEHSLTPKRTRTRQVKPAERRVAESVKQAESGPEGELSVTKRGRNRQKKDSATASAEEDSKLDKEMEENLNTANLGRNRMKDDIVEPAADEDGEKNREKSKKTSTPVKRKRSSKNKASTSCSQEDAVADGVKLDALDVPGAQTQAGDLEGLVKPQPAGEEKIAEAVMEFSQMNLDARTQRAIRRQGFHKPTPVQSAVIPTALSGHDVLVAAPAGSGKTAAYLIPLIEIVLKRHKADRKGPIALILVPARELVHQVVRVTQSFLHACGSDCRVTALSGEKGRGDQTDDINGDVLVGTPAGISSNATQNQLGQIEYLVVDEADLVLSYGYEDETRVALGRVPRTAQALLVSATLGDELDGLKSLVLRKPRLVKVSSSMGHSIANGLGGEEVAGSPVVHHVAEVKREQDKYLVVYSMLRLKILDGKTLFFVNQIDRAFRLKLVLDQFGIRSAVLNSELPLKSRVHCVDQFNAGIFDLLIASDEQLREADQEKQSEPEKAVKGRKRKRDKDFSVMRGIDFHHVATVVNFDCARGVTSYTHRAGRTGRGGASGTVLSLVANVNESASVADIARELDVPLTPLAFRMDQVEPFRYRVEDCLRSVTRFAVREARLRDVRREMLNSDKLKDYFAKNPLDHQTLRHDNALATQVQPHLAHVPKYLVPPALRATLDTGPVYSSKKKRRRATVNKRGQDPLMSFSTGK